ncbi:MAG TPA: helix-turn-helix transcriptional regulator [Rhodocyclaceae bacterium]
MPNLTSTLKQEICRLARKELRSETETLKKSSARYRSEIATLKRRIDELERHVAHTARTARRNGDGSAAEGAIEAPPVNGSAKIRYSAKSLAAQRKRLGLSAAEFGKLVGVSAQSIYNWEAEKARPREKQMAAFAAIRQLGKRDAVSILNREGAQ